MLFDHIFAAFDDKEFRELDNGAKYLVNTLTDHSPATSPDFIRQVVFEMNTIVDFSRCDKIVGEEDRGGYITAIVAYVVDKPFSLVKWNPLGLIGEAKAAFKSAYAEGVLYINGISSGDRIIIVEDFIDTGGTLIALINLIRSIGAIVVDVVAVVEKIDHGAHGRIVNETGISPKWLARVTVGERAANVVERVKVSSHDIATAQHRFI